MKFLAFLLALPLAAQVTVTYVPLPMELLKPYNVKGVGKWDVIACNDGPEMVRLDPERFRVAAVGLRLLKPSDARQMVSMGTGKSTTAKWVEGLTYAALGGAALSGQSAIAEHPQIVKGIAVGVGIGLQIKDKLAAKLPNTGELFTDEISGPVELSPHGCATRSAFAAKVKGAKVVKVTIDVGPAAPEPAPAPAATPLPISWAPLTDGCRPGDVFLATADGKLKCVPMEAK